MVPLEGELGACGNLEAGGSLGTAVAVHEERCDVLDGGVAVGRLADGIKTDLLAVNDKRLEGSVTVGQLGGSQSKSVRVLHFDDVLVGWLVVRGEKTGIVKE